MLKTVTYIHRRFLSAIRGQKKFLRQLQGLLKPVRCPHCRVFTRQVRVQKPWGRQCLACRQRITWTKVLAPPAKVAA
jgi:hypothetical protein